MTTTTDLKKELKNLLKNWDKMLDEKTPDYEVQEKRDRVNWLKGAIWAINQGGN